MLRSEVLAGSFRLRPHPQGYLCFLEIERRTARNEDKERFSGLVFTLDESGDLYALLPPILERLPGAKGVFAKIPKGHRPYGATVFRHSHVENSCTACEAAVLNAFRKMGIKLPPRRNAADSVAPQSNLADGLHGNQDQEE